jgi:hypothetical protein
MKRDEFKKLSKKLLKRLSQPLNKGSIKNFHDNIV